MLAFFDSLRWAEDVLRRIQKTQPAGHPPVGSDRPGGPGDGEDGKGSAGIRLWSQRAPSGGYSEHSGSATAVTGARSAQRRAGDDPKSAVNSPWRLLKKDPKGVFAEAAAEFKRDRASLAGAGLAFYWFLATFPALIAAVAILELLSLGAAHIEIRRIIDIALPPSAAGELTNILNRAGEQSSASVVAATAGLAVALWGASTGLSALQEGFDVAYDIGEIRSFAQKRLKAFKLLAVSALLGGIGILVLAFGGTLGRLIEQNFVDDWPGFMAAWNAVRFGIALSALVALVAVLYRFAPNRRPPPLKWLAPGGLIAVAIMAGTSAGFSVYVTTFGSYASIYGPLAGVVVLVLWLYLTALALLFGAELNALLERRSYDED